MEPIHEPIQGESITAEWGAQVARACNRQITGAGVIEHSAGWTIVQRGAKTSTSTRYVYEFGWAAAYSELINSGGALGSSIIYSPDTCQPIGFTFIEPDGDTSQTDVTINPALAGLTDAQKFTADKLMINTDGIWLVQFQCDILGLPTVTIPNNGLGTSSTVVPPVVRVSINSINNNATWAAGYNDTAQITMTPPPTTGSGGYSWTEASGSASLQVKSVGGGGLNFSFATITTGTATEPLSLTVRLERIRDSV